MKAYELSVKTTEEGALDLPETLKLVLPHGQEVRLIILIDDSARAEEEEAWSRLTTEEFFSGYSDADSIYDKI